jgi:hypothetical protein
MATPVWGSLTDIVRGLGWWGMETDPTDRSLYSVSGVATAPNDLYSRMRASVQ